MQKTHDQNTPTFYQCVTHRSNYCENNLFPLVLEIPWNPVTDPWGSLDPTMRATVLEGKACANHLYNDFAASEENLPCQKVFYMLACSYIVIE